MKKTISLPDAINGIEFTLQHPDGRTIRTKTPEGKCIKDGLKMTLLNYGMP